MASALLATIVVACLLAPSDCAGTCATPMSAKKPDGYADYMARFKKSYATYHKFDAASQSSAKGVSAEVKESLKARNQLRTIPRLLEDPEQYGAGLKLSTRLCGLRYEKGVGGVDCSPEPGLMDGDFLKACYAAKPIPGDACSQPTGLSADGKPDLAKYLISIVGPLAGGIVLAIVFPVLCLLWYILRCCGLFGGSKHSGQSILGAICPLSSGACWASSDKSDVAPYGKLQVLIFKGAFVLFFLLAIISGAIGFTGNGLLNSGLGDSINGFTYGVASTITDVEKVVDTIRTMPNSTDYTAPMDTALSSLKCLIGGLQKSVDDGAPALFGIRSLSVLVVSLIPMFVTLLGVLAAVFSKAWISCCISIQLGWLLIIVWLSFGLHGYLGVLFGDLCIEMDLALHTPLGAPNDMAYLPPAMNPCPMFNTTIAEIMTPLGTIIGIAAAAAGEGIRTLCNTNSFTMDCSGVAGAGKLLGGSPGSYTMGVYSYSNYKAALTLVKVGDPGVKTASCLEFATPTTTASDKCPAKDTNNDCTPPDAWVSSKTNNEVMRTLAACGAPGGGATSCGYPPLYKVACAIASHNSTMSMGDVVAAQLAPFGRCEFLKTVFQPMYMPLCIDSVNGFGLATVSSGMGGAVMLIMLFFAVVAAKRLDKKNQGAGNKVGDFQGDDKLSYAGDTVPESSISP